MKNYDPNMTKGVYIVKITLQIWDYVGHIFRRVGGDCRGRDAIDFDFYEEDAFPDNDCHLIYHEGTDSFSCVLKNEKGGTLQGDYDAEEMNDMIVAAEILCVAEE